MTSPTYTTNKQIEKPYNGQTDWDVPLNADWDLVDTCLAGHSIISVTGVGSGTHALTLAQYQPINIEFTGVLTANLTYQLPANVGGIWTISNATTGNYTLGFSVSGGTPYLLPQGQRSMLVSDGTTVSTAQNSTAPTNQSIGQLIWPQTAQELAASVTPTYYYYPPGDWRRYGADPTGTNDSSAAINNANKSNDRSFDGIGGTYLCSSLITMQVAGQTMQGIGAATVLSFSNSTINNINIESINHCVLRDLKILVTGSTTGNVQSVLISQANYTTVQNVEFQGMAGDGIRIDCSNNCKIINNWFHDFQLQTPFTANYADIHIYCTVGATLGASNNEILFNVCNGTNSEFGISVEDPYFATAASGFPTRTLVEGNIVGPHTGYGLVCYLPGALSGGPGPCNTYNKFVNNDVQGITGAITSNTQSGAGIYITGDGIGSTEVIGNQIFNCCTATATAGLAPAGIGVSGGNMGTGLVPIVISDNLINGMSQGSGIEITGWLGGAIINGNSINMPSTNNGTGPGGAGLQGPGISIVASSNIALTGNNVVSYGGAAALSIYADGVNCAGVTISGGNYTSNGGGYGFQCSQLGGNNTTYLTVSGANFSSVTPDAININAVIVGNFTGCTAESTSGRAIYINGCTNINVTGGYYTGGTVNIGTAGTCTNSYIAKSVNWGTAASAMANAGTGINVEWRSTAAPTVGTWQVGDHVQNSAPTASTTPGWYCTAGGTAGTWTAEAVL